MHYDKKHEFYGTTTVGERGQIVIPSAARTKMKLKNGEKLLTFGMGKDMLIIAKVSQLEKFAAHLSDNLNKITNLIAKNK